MNKLKNEFAEKTLHLTLFSHISTTLKMLEFEDLKERSTLISQEIHASEPLDYKLRKTFMIAVECLVWLVNTGRPDVVFACALLDCLTQGSGMKSKERNRWKNLHLGTCTGSVFCILEPAI